MVFQVKDLLVMADEIQKKGWPLQSPLLVPTQA
jgi:hypothetical protein